jgi:hypothetical protein
LHYSLLCDEVNAGIFHPRNSAECLLHAECASRAMHPFNLQSDSGWFGPESCHKLRSQIRSTPVNKSHTKS